MGAPKLIVASSRLPVSVVHDASGWDVRASPGGLATALRAVAAHRPFTWVGWPGTEVPQKEQRLVTEKLAEHADAVPVFLEDAEREGFYEQVSNRMLWPLLHALQVPRGFDREAWRIYQEVNQRFADTIAEQAEPGDTIWVHDYQLTLVPHLLREKGLDCAIGFFLHIPFPASETFRTLPVREAILRGILGANLIGFHAYEYLSHFRSAALRILGVETDHDPETVSMPGHHARLTTMPIGIEPEEIDDLVESPAAKEQLERLEARYRGRKVILGVDRLDYTKGLPQKLLAYEELLDQHPELRARVVLIQVAAPSRMGVAEYQELKREMDELVGRINGSYGTLDATPLVYINQNVPRDKLTALYQLADIMLVTPVRDGMNLVCLEYVAARGDQPGSLILSEFTGAATCLSGARLVNPHNPSQIAEALQGALSEEPSQEAFDHMKEFVRSNTSTSWAQGFLARLEETYREFGGSKLRFRLSKSKVADLVRNAESPLLLLDYDGTLIPHARVPRDAAPKPRLRELLGRLARVGTVYVLSGRSAELLDEWMGDLPIGLVCEHGLAIKHPGQSWSERPHLPSRALEDIVAPMFKAFAERTPGSRVEQKAASLSWHYRGSDPKFGAWRANELRNLLESQLVGQPYTVLSGSKVIEVRHQQITKGNATGSLLERYTEADLVLCAGNDRSDEEMFEALERVGREPRVVIHVGGVHSGAEFYVESPKELVSELEALASLWEGRPEVPEFPS